MRKWVEDDPPPPTCKGRISMEFFDWEDFMEVAERGESTYGCRESRAANDGRWSGVKNWDAALQLAGTGWIEGAERAARLYEGTMDRLGSLVEVPNVYYDVEGWGIDVAKYLEGEPECCINYEIGLVEGVGKVTRIVASASASAMVEADVIKRRGAALTALVQLLEFSGRPVELVSTCAIRAGSQIMEVSVLVKAAGQPLNLPRVALVLGHPSYLRRLHFSIWETMPQAYHGILNCGYGIPEVTMIGGDVVLERLYGPEPEWQSEGAAEEFVLKTLREQGVKLRNVDDHPAPEVPPWNPPPRAPRPRARRRRY